MLLRHRGSGSKGGDESGKINIYSTFISSRRTWTRLQNVIVIVALIVRRRRKTRIC
jgi:hypothetical protein